MTGPWIRLAALLAGVAALLTLMVAPVGAQGDDRIQILNVEDNEGEITLELALPPSIGRLAPVEANFGLTENGQIIDFTIDPVAEVVDVVVVLDTSGSMRGDALDAAVTAAQAFINELPDDARIGLVSFGETVTVHQSPTLDHNAVLARLGTLSAAGETALWDALVQSSGLLADSGSNRPYVVVLSDGDDTVSSATGEEAVSSLRSAQAGLYAVAIETPDANGLVLEQVVGFVGGQVLTTADVSELQSLYVDVANRLVSRYRMSYTSTADAAEARDVVVSVAVEGGGLATASTNLGRQLSAAEPVISAPAPVLNIDDEASLGPVAPVDLGPFANEGVLYAGLGAMFGALLITGLLLAGPASNMRFDTATGADRLAGFNTRFTATIDRLIRNRDRSGRIDGVLDAAGLSLRPGEFMLLASAGAALIALAGVLLGGPLMAVLLVLTSGISVSAYLSRRTRRRQAAFADQLVDTLGILASGLRAGRGIPQAIEHVAIEAPSPTAEQFRRVMFETRVGRDLVESLDGVASRMGSVDLKWVARAVSINRELGGDLIEVLHNIQALIRDRRRVERQVRATTAEGRATGWFLISLPIIMFLFTLWRSPDSITLMTSTSVGRLMLGLAAVGMIVGQIWIRRLVRARF